MPFVPQSRLRRLMIVAAMALVSGVASAQDSRPSADAAWLVRATDRPLIEAPVPGTETAPQQKAAEKKPPTPEHTGLHALFRNLGDDYKHLWSIDNGVVAGVGGAAALAVHPLDATFNVHLRSRYQLVNDIYAPAKYYGDTPEQVALSLGTYAVGRWLDKPKLSHLGMDLLRAQILSESMVEPIKFIVGRERPNQSNHLSFPSGHASATFAAATIIERHLGWKNAAIGYAIAAYVASSRLHDNVHYLSDVVFGAAVGTIAGRTVTQHGRGAWALAPAPVAGGYGLFVTKLKTEN
jgi:membrane-associated phospholipid phosphatase